MVSLKRVARSHKSAYLLCLLRGMKSRDNYRRLLPHTASHKELPSIFIISFELWGQQNGHEQYFHYNKITQNDFVIETAQYYAQESH